MATYHDDLTTLKDHIKSEREQAHRVYLDNWETKTQFAEGQDPKEIQGRLIMTIEALASTVDHLAICSLSLLEHLEPLVEAAKANTPK